jgi:two-component system, cell cycle response regulator
MTARILVVDDILANVRLLEAKLSAEYFEVVIAMNGLDALEAVERTKPDIVLLDVMMPGIDGVEVCRRIKNNPDSQHIPVIIVTALDQLEDRVRGLEAGADDFLTKPVNDLSLYCRIKSLVRLKMLSDEIRARAISSEAMGLVTSESYSPSTRPGMILSVDTRPSFGQRIKTALGEEHDVVHMEPAKVIGHVTEAHSDYELIIVNVDNEQYDALRLCSQFKSLDQTRQIPILIVIAPDEQERLMRALDMGINDYLLRPIDRQELMARVNTQVRRSRYSQRLRASVQASIELAVTDPLTNLYNRRYMETHLGHMVSHALNRGKGLCVLALDIDYFKQVNDSHGHDVGDRVLRELAIRIKDNVRGVDLACRTGGEEFIVILPGTRVEIAKRIAERIRKAISSRPFTGDPASGPLNITVSVGIAALNENGDTRETLTKRADQALYAAKREGRNRVTLAAA